MSMSMDGLPSAYEAVVRKNKLLAMQAQMMEDWQRLQQKLAALKSALDKEEQDVSRLENSGIAAMFYTVLGTRRERIIKEREEALAAQLKHDQAVSELEDMRRRLEALAAELKTLDGCEAYYARLFEEKKQRLIAEHSKVGCRIVTLSEEISKKKANKEDLRDTVHAGELVLVSLNAALEYLRKAERWKWNQIFGHIPEMMLDDRLCSAVSYISRAQNEMDDFKRKLKLVNYEDDLSEQLTDFREEFRKYFKTFSINEGVLDVIKASLDNVTDVLEETRKARARLGNMINWMDNRIIQMEAEIKMYVVYNAVTSDCNVISPCE